jgi:ATP-binding cassette subfamily C protein LapB
VTIELMTQAARLSGQRIARARRDAAARAASAIDPAAPAPGFAFAWRAAGLVGEPRRVQVPAAADLPLVCWRADGSPCLLVAPAPDGCLTGRSVDGQAVSVHPGQAGAVFVRLVSTRESSQVPRALPRVAAAVWQRRWTLFEAICATAVVSLLGLGVSLYSMQVYDRVIPHQGFQSLWVLTVGVAAALLLEWLLKQVRSWIVDQAGAAIDNELAQWLFERLQHARLDARPTTVGSLAAQVKGLESVRAMLTSTTLYALADVPFALFFLMVIAAIAGPLVAVPLLVLPLALVAGLAFQRAIVREARQMTAGTYLKNGLLVETVEGAESLRAAHGEWQLAARWQSLVEEVSASDVRIRHWSAWSQNLVALLQQGGYVAMVAFGAWLIVGNSLTMGALLAVTIIANRALAPIVQLPSIMVQWAHARAAIEGIDQIVGLPNDLDGVSDRVAPDLVSADLQVDAATFAYGPQRVVLEVPSLAIAPGERVGVLGAIGSGKSSLIKILSGLYRPGSGRVLLGGVDLAALHPAVAREAIGYLPQDPRLVSGTLRANLLLGLPDPGDEAILAASRATGLFELISRHPQGLALGITEGGRGVSGGQRQLIGLTRMLLGAPRLWLLDEPTASMDNETETRVIRLLHERLGPQDTLVVATHKTAFLPALTRIIVVRDGRIVLDGARDAVLAALKGGPGGAQAVPGGGLP